MSTRRPHTVTGFALLIMFLAAGCADGIEAEDAGPLPTAPPVRPEGAAPIPEPTQDTGAMVVLVVSSEYEPVPTAQVVLAHTEFMQFTDAEGRAVFNNLTPAKYTALAAKPGFTAREDKGKLVEVAAGEITETMLTLEERPKVTKEQSYHSSVPLDGFISCSLVVNVLNYNRTLCRGGPNDNPSHPWEVENPHVQTLIMEATWDPTIEVAGARLLFATYSSLTCHEELCSEQSIFMKGVGDDGVYVALYEGPKKAITDVLGDSADAYPKFIVTQSEAYCDNPCATVVFEQSYSGWASAFYGGPAPAGWSAFDA